MRYAACGYRASVAVLVAGKATYRPSGNEPVQRVCCFGAAAILSAVLAGITVTVHSTFRAGRFENARRPALDGIRKLAVADRLGLAQPLDQVRLVGQEVCKQLSALSR